MTTGFWISFAFTCGMFIGHWLPRLIEWLLERPVNKGYDRRKKK